MKVLVVEDNLMNQLLMRMYMSKLGWEYTIVENGLLGIEACRTGDFNVILMDINMPELDGIEATRQIRVFDKGIPIIAFTAYGDNTNRIRCAEAGMNALLEKPVSHNIIHDLIIELVSLNGLRIA